ncbi:MULTISPECIES: Fe-S cluster assembly protein SufD [Dyella]|uniref:Fe-S cluster assembly protein SufD n=2 Tax=Dyella TaxID=231454 RepID=A0A4R0YT17_9GAMM|nr:MULTISPECIES: Fe-S cluster assembly protein SufD [Dyella]TBR40046.1 Fe-S cluster assembly protein SufD [Dyella terrae]TCI12372.1 Fe-S cluster assembly protein SufD [Dyella soli]
MNEAVRTPFVESQLQAVAPGAGPAWLDAVRRESLAAFEASGLPERNEAWKYTALRALGQRRFATGDSQAATRAVDEVALALPGVNGARLVFVHGIFRADLSRIESQDGLTIQPLSDALAGDSDWLRFAFSNHAKDASEAFTQLNGALATDGVVVRVAAGVTMIKPVHVVFVGAPAEGDLAWHVRNVIEVGQGASLSLVEHFLAAGPNAHIGTAVTDVVLREGARLQQLAIQDSAEGSSLIRRSHYQLGAQAHALLHVLELGGGLVRHDLRAELNGDNARFDSRGVFALHGRQHVDTQLAIRHQALNTQSESIWRGVADQRSRGVIRGAIVVAEGADGSDAMLSSKNLLLSGQAEIDTKPELEIYADEVKAAHGATVGQLDERAMFYLRSRGIPHAQARALLTAAFCRAVFESIELDALREHVSDLLLAHLPTENLA